MKKLLFCFLLLPYIIPAQTPGQWTWMKGAGSVTASLPVYGTKGVASPASTPGSLYESCEWTDNQGNFWIFGGLDPTGNEMGDLWKFDPVSTDWTWVKGPGIANLPGVYGTKGIPNATNQPGGRSYGMVSWVDNNGTFWMFGGYGYDSTGGVGYLDDLWNYDVTTSQWTWVSGSNIKNAAGTYGTKGVPGLFNVPPGKCEIATGWPDANGNLWLFGGLQTGNLYYNDLWKYTIASNEWTWMRGDSTSSSLGYYGPKGVADPANDPPSRLIYAKWKDASGNFWMFGGNATTYGQMNDMWKFDPLANQWTWENGPKTGIDQGLAGPPCTGDATYRPCSRYENRAVWTDACGNFYNFGGYHVTGLFSMSTIDDLWQYNPVTNQWKFINGGPDGNPGNFGTLGVSSATNMPPGLCGSNAFTDAKGNFWMFGGVNYGVSDAVNCVWRFVPDTTCNGTCAATVPPVASFQASDTSLCANDCISFANLSLNATSYQWTFSGGIPGISTDVNPQNICYLTEGIFSVTLIATNGGKNDTLSFVNYIYVSPAPKVPNIIRSNDTLYCSYDTSYKSYQWYYNNTIIPGATNSFVLENQSGNYNVAVSNSIGCNISAGIIIEGIQDLSSDKNIFISPNPAGDEFTVYGLPFTAGEIAIKLYNVLGENVASKQIEHGNPSLAVAMNVSTLSKGIYFVVIANDSRKWIGKLVKQ